jgi:large subunit ribosomal protein L3
MAAVKGILGRKLGMTQVWDSDNRVIPVTVIQAGPCRVVQLKTPERDGYSAVQIAFGAAKEQRLTKPELGHLKKNGAAPSKHLAELRVDDLSPYAVGQVIGADVFAAGERVDVTGISKGKGFTGVMQRHNFKGQGASHGNHKKHRSPGSIGACATPARVFKGMKMAGQHGNERVTTLNLEVVEGDVERGLLLVKGAVPGPNGAIVFVRNAVKGGVVAPPELGGGNGGGKKDTKTDEPALDADASDSEPGASVSEAGAEVAATEESDTPPSSEGPEESEAAE